MFWGVVESLGFFLFAILQLNSVYTKNPSIIIFVFFLLCEISFMK